MKNSKNKAALLVLISCIVSMVGVAQANAQLNKQKEIPPAFQGATENSEYVIDYSDLNELLTINVLETGMSNRQKAQKDRPSIGSRISIPEKRRTIEEANRFFYENFNNPRAFTLVKSIKKSLEALPTDAPLRAFSSEEQLAYWLNLYNITVIDQVLARYPQRNLADALVGNDNFLDQKLLKVAGIELSLNDIQDNILMPKYDDPLILYGLYQGHIGGPNIRRQAYTGKNVYQLLNENAREFVNSNRGTQWNSSTNTFKVSQFYTRNQAYFNGAKTNLAQHLKRYLNPKYKGFLGQAESIDTDLNNYTVADLFGSMRNTTSSVSTRSWMALEQETTGIQSIFSAGAIDQVMLEVKHGRFVLSEDQVRRLLALNNRYLVGKGQVTIKDLESQSDATQ